MGSIKKFLKKNAVGCISLALGTVIVVNGFISNDIQSSILEAMQLSSTCTEETDTVSEVKEEVETEQTGTEEQINTEELKDASNTSVDKLLPCPLCGEEVKFKMIDCDYGATAWILCESCGLTTAHGSFDSSIIAQHEMTKYWNTRD